MEKFTLHILGCGSAKPTLRHLPTAQIVDVHDKFYMIDCGEGAQLMMQKMQLPMLKLNSIFISHNHGDHVFGLPGLLSTMALLGRTAALDIYGPEDMKGLLELITGTYLEGIGYEVRFHPVRTHEHYIVMEDRSIRVWSIPMNHRVPCVGYLVEEQQGLPHIRREMIDAFNIPLCQINNIKAGQGWTTEDGKILTHEMLTVPAEPARRYAYCSDTRYKKELAEIIRGVNLLYHEATYPEELQHRAEQTLHSTAREAAQTAKDAQVKRLVIGHYSARVKDEESLLEEAKSVFEDCILAKEGMKIDIF